MLFQFSEEISRFFKSLSLGLALVENVSVRQKNDEVEKFLEDSMEAVKKLYTLDQLSKHPVARAYRDFFWKINIDPTKTRPSAEALVRRVLLGKGLPRVNSLVDVCNAVSMKTLVPMAAYDAEKLSQNLVMRFSRAGELFKGIGMDTPVVLTGKEVVIADAEKIVAVYPHRDSDSSKVTESTAKVVLMVWGVPGLEFNHLKEVLDELVAKILNFCGGHLVSKQLFTTGL